MQETFEAKHILNVHKHCDGGWFWEKYTATPYSGCSYGCEYCYAREEKYYPHKRSQDSEITKLSDPFSEYIKIKCNAAELFRKELSKKPLDLIIVGSYQPVEAKYHFCRRMLEICLELGFPVYLNEKSPLLLQDIDLLLRIRNKSYLNVGWSIIASADDNRKEAFEPKTPSIEARFDAMRVLSENGIITGTIFMPILPFVYDNEEDIQSVIKKTSESGGKYVLEGGLSLFGQCKDHFYASLWKYNPKLIAEYDKLYKNPQLLKQQQKSVHELILKYCQKYNLSPFIPRPTEIYSKELQINKQLAAEFYLKARELQLNGQDSYREWAFRKAAWSLDDLDISILQLYKEKNVEGLLEVKAVGRSIANFIAEYLQSKN